AGRRDRPPAPRPAPLRGRHVEHAAGRPWTAGRLPLAVQPIVEGAHPHVETTATRGRPSPRWNPGTGRRAVRLQLCRLVRAARATAIRAGARCRPGIVDDAGPSAHAGGEVAATEVSRGSRE